MNDQPGPASDDADAGSDPAREPSTDDEGAPGPLDEAAAPSDAAGPSTDGTGDVTPSEGDASDGDAFDDGASDGDTADDETPDVPPEVRKYERFKKMDGARYERVNDFLRDRTYVTAREWAIARLCADFRTETGVEMTKIGENLPELVPFMTDTYTPQAVNQARYSFEEKVTKAGATFLYGAMSGFFTAEDLDEMMYEVTEVAKFLLEVEGVDLAVADELEAEDKISEVMREVRASSAGLRGEEVRCPECGHVHEPAEE
ncbi:hypothetical protein DJ82_09580 [Halorubrum sp. Ib24]|uniref:DUF5806 family protein n=1 Tax=unclassified Halorubrum TaxID=2642239 RepID=UPI000B98B558|nr:MULTISPECIES: DUF5806 family protein [unclassified Halorubrum]OYR39406.1 hypothetical protein DJ82_09580 [Halorubrum sp. Ib24]OYR44628.1 hypothetical protein DJ75_09070 [Halorubrum sp. Eb13]OYR46964.1 hypothetical protein DJ81_01680 [Halorubrum sp. Hd13]OYR54214.1 hypothetical protein DJ73_05590 [Halorubrum sp. Ea1]